MNKKIELDKNTKLLIVFNLFVFVFTLLFKKIYDLTNISPTLLNIMLVVDILVLILGIVFNIIMIKKGTKYNNKKVYKLIIISFVSFIILNTLVVFLLNIPFNKKVSKVSNKLIKYCEYYACDSYEIKKDGGRYDFVISKKYLDYDNIYNNLEIHNYFNSDVEEVKAVVYSRSESYSEYIIKEAVMGWFENYGVNIDQDSIYKSFNDQYKSSDTPDKVEKDGVTYVVKDTFENKKFIGFKTIITYKK